MNCPRCGSPAELVPQYQRWFCRACEQYVPAPPPPKPTNLGLAIGLPLGILGGLVVLGILAAVAIPAFIGYTKKTRRAETTEYLQEIARGAEAYYDREQRFPAPGAGPTPALGTCCMTGGKCMPDRRQWRDDPVWGPDGLQFSIDRPHYYSYQYQVNDDGSEFTASAYGDLDCDGESSTFELDGSADAAGVHRSTIIQIRPTE